MKNTTNCPVCKYVGSPTKAYYMPVYENKDGELIRQDSYLKIGQALHAKLQSIMEATNSQGDVKIVRDGDKYIIEIT